MLLRGFSCLTVIMVRAVHDAWSLGPAKKRNAHRAKTIVNAPWFDGAGETPARDEGRCITRLTSRVPRWCFCSDGGVFGRREEGRSWPQARSSRGRRCIDSPDGSFVQSLVSGVAASPARNTAVKAGLTPSPSSLATQEKNQPLSTNNQLYNQFNYILRTAPESWRQERNAVTSHEEVNLQLFKQFVDRVLEYNAKGKVQRTRKFVHVNKLKEGGDWMGHHEAAEKEAPDVLVEQIRVGTVSTRLHPRLQANPTIPWPQNLQIRCGVQSEQRIKMTEKATENAFETEYVESFDTLDAEYMKYQMRRHNKV